MPVEDVVIIGAGIAGLTAAKFISSKGVSPLVLESGKTVCDRVCGEGIHDKTVDGMNFLNLYESKKGILRKVSKTLANFEGIERKFEYPIHMVDKMTVQKEFARQAKSYGARFKFSSKVTGIKRSGKHLLLEPHGIKAKLVIGCDGYYSVCRSFLKQKISESAFGVGGYVKKRASRIEVHFIEKGYVWNFPRKEDCNVGVGCLWGAYDVNDLITALKDFFGDVRKIRGAAIPIGYPCKTYGNNMMLVGDSASQILSLSGGGILTSMICARLCADVAVEAAKSGNFDSRFLAKYERSWKKILGQSFYDSHRYTKALHKLLENRTLAKFGFRTMYGVIQKKLEEEFVA